jgi:predicted DCC family thiol-disulfide oxidoreductase YuxK
VLWRDALQLGRLAIFGTNLSLIIFAVGNVFMQAFDYSFGDFHHPEGLMMITLSIFALSPAGRALSIDDLYRRVRSNRSRKKFEEFDPLDGTLDTLARWPLLLTQWMFALAYLSGCMSKLLRSELDWTNGFTLQYYLVKDGLRWGSDLGVWLGQQEIIVWLLSWLTILWEGTFFLVIIFPSLAWLYVPMGIAFHIGIDLTMNATFFHWITLYAVFVPWTLVVKKLPGRRFGQTSRKVEIFFDGDCPLCIRSMTVLCYLDWFKQLAFADLATQWTRLSGEHTEVTSADCSLEMHVLLPNGLVYKGFFAFRQILWCVPFLWPLLAIFYSPFASTVGPKIYRAIATRRSRFQVCDTNRKSKLAHHN